MMTFATLIEGALACTGNAVLIIAHPGAGGAARIEYANLPFTRMAKHPAPLAGSPLDTLRALAQDPAQWSLLIDACAREVPLELDMRLCVAGQPLCFAFDLTFQGVGGGDARYGVMIGRDVTQARLAAERDHVSRHMLASVFLRVSAPVVIVAASGAIVMANPAFQRLLGYSAEETHALCVDRLTAAAFSHAAHAARARQLQDGRSYEMHIETLAKNGTRVAVTLTSVLLHDGDQRQRVVTLIPDRAGSTFTTATANAVSGDQFLVAPHGVGQVQVISLAAFKTALGREWRRFAVPAMMKAEHVLKERLAVADVVCRSDDHGLVIWFDSTDERRNAAVVAAVEREIRLLFLEEFGVELAASLRPVPSVSDA